MEHTQCSETLAFKLQTPGNNPEESTWQILWCFDIRWSMQHFVLRHDVFHITIVIFIICKIPPYLLYLVSQDRDEFGHKVNWVRDCKFGILSEIFGLLVAVSGNIQGYSKCLSGFYKLVIHNTLEIGVYVFFLYNRTTLQVFFNFEPVHPVAFS
jgi:hypothetical protein